MSDTDISQAARALVNEDGGFPSQEQSPPGLTDAMRPKPDHGEQSYVGHERLAGLRALITGGDSGIGRAVAIAFAREGADVALSYLDDEQAGPVSPARWRRRTCSSRLRPMPDTFREPSWASPEANRCSDVVVVDRPLEPSRRGQGWTYGAHEWSERVYARLCWVPGAETD